MKHSNFKSLGSRVFAFLFLTLFSIPVFAESYTLTLEEAIQKAMDQSLNLKKSAVDLAQTGYASGRRWSEIFPGFSLSGTVNLLPATELFTDPGFSYNDDKLSYSFGLGVNLSLNPSLRASMKRIELAYRSQLLSYENSKRQLEVQVIKSFLNLVAMKEDIAYRESYLAFSEQITARDRIARANGVLSELAWLNSQLNAETARYNLSSVRGNYQNSLGEFLSLLGMDAGMEIVFQGTLKIAPVLYESERLILEYLSRRPDIISQRQNIERMELSKSIAAWSARSPSLNLSARWGTPSAGINFNDPFTDTVSGSVTLNIPIDGWIPGTKQSQTVRAADAEIEKARLDLQNTETLAKTQIRSQVSNLRQIWENIAIARRRVEIAQSTVNATDQGFRNGTVEFRDLVDTHNKLSEARQQLLMGELSYQSLLLDLAAALNVEWKTLTQPPAGGSLGETARDLP